MKCDFPLEALADGFLSILCVVIIIQLSLFALQNYEYFEVRPHLPDLTTKKNIEEKKYAL